HRALHNNAQGRPENSAAAVQAAVDAGYAIEIDVQLSVDNKAVVFHDYDLARLTDGRGAVRERTADDLKTVPLKYGGGAGIPSLSSVLEIIDGQVPLLIEIKDQDGALGAEVGALENAVAQAINDYSGPIAVMSFNPHSVAAMQTLAPDVPRGLVTEYFRAADWKAPPDRLAALTHIDDYDKVGACFISHNRRDLQCTRLAELKSQGARILTWTIRSPKEETNALHVAENITFEGYRPNRRS
ncbi:MAG: glycerophosphodiester phosphodiesterase family protein, partial [Marinomonas sp.]